MPGAGKATPLAAQAGEPALSIAGTRPVPPEQPVIATERHAMPTIPVLDSTIAYRETGEGTPVVFLHGNPTSSYLWRKILPAVGAPGRLLAPDLIGMGASGKPDIAYSFDDHSRYLEAWMDVLGLEDIVLVGHDWGAPLAFDWATRHPGRALGIAFTSPVLKPMTWEEFGPARPFFEALRTPGVGEKMILEDNVFIEEVLPQTAITGLSEEDLAAYREPYSTPQSRRPMLQWARSMPLAGEPADVVTRVEAFGTWLAASTDVPKLYLTFEPGLSPEQTQWSETHLAALEIEQLGPAGHDAEEDQPEAIAGALASWLDRHHLRQPAKR
ncbi:haloalkane dehalogenase [Streptomyces sp. NBC_00237]|uniref:haloalkane dehalogenase n=1 Tax=Streptomyces sp. NBC_00237 TaxID=2975687 RepID=UPI00224E54F0|nr:haloalkane dehalogenase [Streptomyces sp. NBC_00237]MCX5205687.1 haloalkane dehalogenase [Streptomyces sp. NBC_00237]